MAAARPSTRLHALALIGIIAVVFAPALAGEFVYDDVPLIARNTRLRDVTGWGRLFTEPYWGADTGYWRPLTALVLALGFQIGGALGIHALALGLHAAAALTAARLARRLGADDRRGWLVALLFAVHPVQVESVAWAAAINDPLWGLCALLAIDAWLGWRERGSSGIPFAACAALAAALLTKENALATVPLLWVVDRVWLRRRGSAQPGGSLLGLGALVGCVALYALARVLVFGTITAGFDRAEIDVSYTGARRWTAPIELLGRFVGVLGAPVGMTPFRGLTVEVEAPTMLWAASWIAVGTALVVLVGRRQPGPVAVAAAFIVLPIAPALFRFDAIGAYPVADRYLYLGAFGWAWALTLRSGSRGVRIALLVVAALCAAWAFRLTFHWQDQRSLVEHGLALAPADPGLLVMLGNLELRDGRENGDAAALQRARHAFDEAARRTAASPSGPDAPRHRALADALVGIGWCELIAQQARPRPDPSIPARRFEQALAAAPDHATACIGLGVCQGMGGRLADAERSFLRAIALDPTSSEAEFNLGFLYSRSGRTDLARTHAQRALDRDPDNAAARGLLDSLR